MALKVMAVMVVLVLLQAVSRPMVEAARGKAVSTSEAGAVLCNMTQDGLMACKPAVTQPNPTKPTASCCAALKTADLKCLCSYKNSMLLPTMGIDPTLALGLPTQCKLEGVAPDYCAWSVSLQDVAGVDWLVFNVLCLFFSFGRYLFVVGSVFISSRVK